MVDATVTYDQPEMGQLLISMINQVIEMKGLDHHLLCPMKCHMNCSLINEVPTFLPPIPSETMHAIQI